MFFFIKFISLFLLSFFRSDSNFQRSSEKAYFLTNGESLNHFLVIISISFG